MTRSGRSHVLLVSHQATRTGAPRIAVEIARVLTEQGERVTTLRRVLSDADLLMRLGTAARAGVGDRFGSGGFEAFGRDDVQPRP